MNIFQRMTIAIVVALATVLGVTAAHATTATPVPVQVQIGCSDAFIQSFNTGRYTIVVTTSTRVGTIRSLTTAQGFFRTFLDLNALRGVTGVEVQVLSGGAVVLDRRTVAC